MPDPSIPLAGAATAASQAASKSAPLVNLTLVLLAIILCVALVAGFGWGKKLLQVRLEDRKRVADAIERLDLPPEVKLNELKLITRLGRWRR